MEDFDPQRGQEIPSYSKILPTDLNWQFGSIATIFFIFWLLILFIDLVKLKLTYWN